MLRKFIENKKAISALAVVGIIAALVVVGGAYYAYSHNLIPSNWISQIKNGFSQITHSGSTTTTVGDATSLKFNVAITSNGVSQGSYLFYAKNIKTDNSFMIRVEETATDGTQSIYIVNAQQQQAWSYTNGEWTDVSSTYSSQYSTWYGTWHGYVQYLSLLTGGGFTYTSGTNSYTISNINVNPSLDDSLFTHS